YDVGGKNALSREWTISPGINIYLGNYPTSIRKFLIYAGVAFPFGWSKISEQSLDRDYRYQVMSIPQARLGLKYRFISGDEYENWDKLGLGINFLATYGRRRLKLMDERPGEVYEQFVADDLTAQVGLSFFF